MLHAGTMLDSEPVARRLQADPAGPSHSAQNALRFAWGVTLATYGPDDSAGEHMLTYTLFMLCMSLYSGIHSNVVKSLLEISCCQPPTLAMSWSVAIIIAFHHADKSLHADNASSLIRSALEAGVLRQLKGQLLLAADDSDALADRNSSIPCHYADESLDVDDASSLIRSALEAGVLLQLKGQLRPAADDNYTSI